MRVGGRLGKSKTLTYDTRHPIILPNSDCEVVQSLIRHYHTKHYHCSIVETYYLLRQKYYFLGGRNTVRKVVSKCLECQLAYKQPTPQKMGELPESRVSLAIPFQHSGMDVFGEFWGIFFSSSLSYAFRGSGGSATSRKSGPPNFF